MFQQQRGFGPFTVAHEVLGQLCFIFVEAKMAIDKQPTKREVRRFRLSVGLSGAESASIIGKAPRTWRSIEAGDFKMLASDWSRYRAEVERRAQAGELVVSNHEWVPVSEAARFLGRSRMTVLRLVESKQVRRVMKNSRMALYNKSDLREVKKGLSSLDNSGGQYCTRLEAVELIGGISKLNSLRRAGLLTPVKKDRGLFFKRSDVAKLADRIKKESALLTVGEAAKQLGITRQGLSAMLSSMKAKGNNEVVPVQLLSGRKGFTQDMVDRLAEKRAR